MGILTDKVKGNKIIDSPQLEEVFNFIISKFEESYSKSTNILLIEILNDYYEAVEILESKNIIIKKEFNFFIFTQLMAKIKSIGILKSSLDKNNFSQYRKYLLNEIEKSDPIVSKSISYILSDNYIINSDKDTLRDLNIFWANYLEILVNLHQYKKENIKTNIRIAESYIKDFTKINNDSQTIESTKKITDWLKKIVNIYAI